jgi:preprotein translocase YajC subunit
METITSLLWTSLIIAMVVFTYIVIRNTIRSERSRKSFRNVMKPGDEVKVPTIDYFIGEILEVNDDEVKVVVKVNKSMIYPNTKK